MIVSNTCRAVSIAACISMLFGCSKNASINEDPTPNKPELGPEKVQVVNVNGRWRLYREGEMFYIRGAAPGASTYVDDRPDYYYGMLADYGGNTIRTYGVNEHTQRVLDAAHANGIAVGFGLYVRREADGFDYDNEELVQQQLEEFTEVVRQYKDHPALLVWFVGNEAEASYTNLKLWDAVNDICAMIHEEDPDHPTTAALSNSDPNKIRAIIERAPELDILSINMYAPSLPNVLSNIQSAGWEKPYMITEFGPRGTWQMNPEPERILEWGALVEQTSTEKEQIYRNCFQDHILSNINNGCIGSFVFMWGYQTHGAVATWFGLHNSEGRAFGAADAMQFCWTGQYPANRAPMITSREKVLLNGKRAEENIKVIADSTNHATVLASDPDGDPLEYEWLISPEGAVAPDGGPHLGIPGLINSNGAHTVTFTAPSAGTYRLYVYVKDDHNKVASAVIPFLVE